MKVIHGISLLVSQYRDNDGIINILTEEGLVPVLGKSIFSINNKNHIFSKAFIEGDYEIYQGKVGGDKLKACNATKYYYEFENDYKKSVALNFISEMTLKGVDGIDDFPFLYKLVNYVLNKLEKNADEYYLIALFIAKLLVLLGIGIDCKLNDSYGYLSLNEGKLVNELIDNNTFPLVDEEEEFLKQVFNKKVPAYVESFDYLRLLKMLVIFYESHIDTKINAISLIL